MSRRAAGRRGLPSRASVSAPADRRFRRPDARPVRRRLVPFLRRVLRLGVPLVLAVGVGAAVVAFLLTTDALAVRQLVVGGNSRLAPDDLDALLDGLRGKNILRVDFQAYRRRVLESPWVADVAIARVLPSTIRLDITERVPMAIARLDRQLYLVDQSGVIIDEFGPRYAEFDLPIVDGLVTAPARGAPAVDPDRARLTGRFLSSVGEHPALRDRLSQVDVSNEHDVAALLDDDPAWLHLGDAQFAERLQAYLELAPALRERMPDLDYVDMRFGARVFVRARGRSAEFPRQ
jgi:cell division septal protein FtsQ